MIKAGDEVTVAYGVFYQGHDLSDLRGVVKDTTSYILVWIPLIELEVKLFRNEVFLFQRDIFDEITEEMFKS